MHMYGLSSMKVFQLLRCVNYSFEANDFTERLLKKINENNDNCVC